MQTSLWSQRRLKSVKPLSSTVKILNFSNIMMASKGWRVVQAHIPMIKFRKGGIERAAADAVATSSRSAGAATAPPKTTQGSTGPGIVSRPVIEDFQLPSRYQRRPLDIKEIDYINRGGPE